MLSNYVRLTFPHAHTCYVHYCFPHQEFAGKLPTQPPGAMSTAPSPSSQVARLWSRDHSTSDHLATSNKPSRSSNQTINQPTNQPIRKESWNASNPRRWPNGVHSQVHKNRSSKAFQRDTSHVHHRITRSYGANIIRGTRVQMHAPPPWSGSVLISRICVT